MRAVPSAAVIPNNRSGTSSPASARHAGSWAGVIAAPSGDRIERRRTSSAADIPARGPPASRSAAGVAAVTIPPGPYRNAGSVMAARGTAGVSDADGMMKAVCSSLLSISSSAGKIFGIRSCLHQASCRRILRRVLSSAGPAGEHRTGHRRRTSALPPVRSRASPAGNREGAGPTLRRPLYLSRVNHGTKNHEGRRVQRVPEAGRQHRAHARVRARRARGRRDRDRARPGRRPARSGAASPAESASSGRTAAASTTRTR